MHDDMQAMRVLQLDKCIHDGQIPCRWVPDMGYGYGYPQFIYYSPLPYYVMEAFHLLGFSIIGSVKAGIVLGFILSGFFMFLLGRSLWGDLGGLVSAVFYLFAPFRASDIYTRGAMGEFWALVFLPLIFWSIYQLISQERLKYIVFLALSYAGLLLTHNITSLSFTIMAGAWALFLICREKNVKIMLKTVAGFVWGGCLAGFFILPAFFEKRYAHVETMVMGYFNYLAHFVSLGQLFFSNRWGYGSSELGPYDDLSFSIGTFHWLFSFLALILAIFLRKKEKKYKTIIFVFALFLLSAFMIHQRSVFIWNALPLMAYFQFPWRFLTNIVFVSSLLAGSIMLFVRKEKSRKYLGVLMILGVVLLNAFYFRPREWYFITDKDKFSGESWEKQLTISIFDYLPIFAKAPPATKAPDQPIFVEGDGEIVSFKKGTNWQEGGVRSENTVRVQLPLFYFSGFTLWVDGQKQKIDYRGDLGLISFSLPPGEHNFSVKLQSTPVRSAGDFLTLLGIAGIGGAFIYEKVKYGKK